jgi:tetratricopeptide (TPR) repeat protein
MDQLSAHLDRGWDLAQKGDAQGALACARRALELDPKSADVHNLFGYAAALDGNTDEALEHYRQAIALDETYLEAMLNLAEVLVPLGEWDEAVALCNDGLDYAETNEEIADCVLLKADALLGKGQSEEAAKALALIPAGPYDNPSYDFLIGRAYYEVGQPEKAVPLIEDASRRDPMNADARYYLGLVRDEKGDSKAATDAFLHTRALDLMQPSPPWAPSPEAFAAIVQGAIQKVDSVLGRYVREAEAYCFDVVGAELVVDGIDPRALCIVEAPAENGGPPRGRIFVYQRNIERAAGSLDALEDELVHALEHEIANVFVEQKAEPTLDKEQLN